MKTILDTDNVFDYLIARDYCQEIDRDTIKSEIISAKNFNILIKINEDCSLLVKQEIHDVHGETSGEFWAAWQMQQLTKHFPDFGEKIRDFLPELLYFDPDNSILIVKYATDFDDLASYYHRSNQFSIVIASAIGQLLATIHSHTFERSAYQQFFQAKSELRSDYTAFSIIRRLSRITPQVFQIMPPECLQFFKLYQRFPSLLQAIVDLGEAIEPSCLIHNDLKINNILLALNWDCPSAQVIRLIDWERANWGDPAFDLGCILGSYLEVWLDGLIIGNTLSINESLQLATTPLELLQPSLFSLTRSYLDGFPAIAIARPDFLDRVIQFAGLALIQRVEITIDEDRSFGNRGIIMLQVAKQLLCTPQSAMNTLFGSNYDRLTN
ncbi:phosphotransferase [Chamaesiphon sp. VAR_48_metabat_135_sub]|uniref:phosphotransferase family protein n=1 Tax=Chamaesiphon sp. VAR_48_metabat_135_sub TaxID=2964699 RepID=UPI00286B2E47|nr:phosphotransferase [Chamaesiphon sp. VAR_48_metabat_135_sub]